MSEFLPIQINSHKGFYNVLFLENIFEKVASNQLSQTQIIIDKNVKELYSNEMLKFGVNLENALIIEATEQAKSFDQIGKYIEFLVANKIRRGHTLVAIGGGVIQDIVCFISSVFLRGLDWVLIPTTLLAQADSCIGSKSSINVGDSKNILGTFNPPKEILISTHFLDTLNEDEIKSGIGEILKLYAVCGENKFNELSEDYPFLIKNREILLKYIYNSLCLKKNFIEKDEFDRSSRLVLNYGHSFGHAIETATHFKIPHGIAVSMGCHFANYVAWKLKLNNGDVFKNMSLSLISNFEKFIKTGFDFKLFLESLLKDKKNVGEHLVLILPNNENNIVLTKVEKSNIFISICKEFLVNELKFKV